MSEEKGIKEIKELFKALEVLAGVAGAVAKDGKVGVDDLSHLISLGVQFQTIAEGFSGLGDVSNEAKDLKKEEVIELIGAAYSVVKAFETAKK